MYCFLLDRNSHIFLTVDLIILPMQVKVLSYSWRKLRSPRSIPSSSLCSLLLSFILVLPCVYMLFSSFSLLDQLPWGSEFMHQGMIYHVSVHLVRTWHWGFFLFCVGTLCMVPVVSTEFCRLLLILCVQCASEKQILSAGLKCTQHCTEMLSSCLHFKIYVVSL